MKNQIISHKYLDTHKCRSEEIEVTIARLLLPEYGPGGGAIVRGFWLVDEDQQFDSEKG